MGRDSWLGLAALFVAAAVVVLEPAPVDRVRFRALEVLQTVRHAADPPEYGTVVTIVDIDEDSLAGVGSWPWPPMIWADLLVRVAEAGAVVIGVDHRFAPDPRGAGAPEIQKVIDMNEAPLAESVARTRVVLGRWVGDAAPDENPAPPAAVTVRLTDPEAGVFLPAFPAQSLNVPALDAAAAGHGVLSTVSAPNGVAQRVPTVNSVDGTVHPSMFVEMLRVAMGRPEVVVEGGRAGVEAVRIGDQLTLHPDQEGLLWMWYADVDRRRYVSAVDVLQGADAIRRIKGKFVLIGATATGLATMEAIPGGRQVPRVEVHAQAIERAIDGRYLHRPRHGAMIELAVALGLGLVAIIALPTLPRIAALFAVLAIEATLGGFAWILVRTQGVLFDPAIPGLVFAVVCLLLVLGRSRRPSAHK